MGRQSQDVVVRFVGDTGNLARGMDGLKGRFVGVASSLDGIAKAGAVVAAASFFTTAIGEAREAERVTRKTEAVIKSTGAVANVTSKHIADLSEKLSELAGVDDEVIQQGSNVLLTFKGVRNEVGQGNDIFDQAAKVSLDMAAALDKTGDSGDAMQENAIRIGKALNDPVRGMTALTKVGVTFTQQQKDQVAALVESGDVLGAQKVILRELQSEFGGMAAASADSMSKAQVSWANFAEDVGKKVMPAVNAVSNWTLETGIPALGSLASTVGNVVEPAFQGFVAIGRETVEMWQSLPGPIQAGVVALGAWMLVGDRVSGFFGRTTGPLRTFGEDVRTVMTASQGEVGRLGASMQVLQDRSVTIGAMGAAFRQAKGDAEGFGGTLRGSVAGGMAGFKAAGRGLVSFLGGPWGLAIAGAAMVLGAFASHSAKAEQHQNDMASAGRRVAQAIREQNGEINKSTRAAAVKEAGESGLLAKAKELGIELPRVTDALMGQGDSYELLRSQIERKAAAHENESGVMTGITDLVGEHSDGITTESEKYQQLLDDLDLAVEGRKDEVEAQKLQGEAAAGASDALSQYGITAAAAKTSTELYREAIEGAGLEYDESASKAEQLRVAIEALTQSEINQMDTLEGYEAAMDALDAGIAANGSTLDIHTEKGRANRDLLEDLATKSRALMQADIDAGVPADEALARHDARIAALQKEATETFGATSQALGLIDTYGKVPKSVRTAIITEGYEATHAKMMSLSAGQFLLSEGIPITPANTRAVLNERRNRFAEGGPVAGPGSATSDSIPAMLSQGEFVQRAAAVDYYGPTFMSALNQKRIPREAVPGFAAGGMVWPFPVDVSKTKIPNPAFYPGGSSIAALKGFAMMQKGKRYLWGATGPDRWDCSGLVGAVWALAHGKAPYRRYMTTATMGVGRHGMKAGPGAVTVYLGLGHTAMNIGGLHAEAYGGNGVPLAIGRVGTPLSYYNQVMHMRKGGLAALKGSAAARQESFLATGWPEPGRVGQFRNGGWLEPGHFAYNETSKSEAVFNQDQLAQLSRPTVHKTMNVNLNVANRPVDVMQQLRFAEMMAGF